MHWLPALISPPHPVSLGKLTTKHRRFPSILCLTYSPPFLLSVSRGLLSLSLEIISSKLQTTFPDSNLPWVVYNWTSPQPSLWHSLPTHYCLAPSRRPASASAPGSPILINTRLEDLTLFSSSLSVLQMQSTAKPRRSPLPQVASFALQTSPSWFTSYYLVWTTVKTLDVFLSSTFPDYIPQNTVQLSTLRGLQMPIYSRSRSSVGYNGPSKRQRLTSLKTDSTSHKSQLSAKQLPAAPCTHLRFPQLPLGSPPILPHLPPPRAPGLLLSKTHLRHLLASSKRTFLLLFWASEKMTSDHLGPPMIFHDRQMCVEPILLSALPLSWKLLTVCPPHPTQLHTQVGPAWAPREYSFTLSGTILCHSFFAFKDLTHKKWYQKNTVTSPK